MNLTSKIVTLGEDEFMRRQRFYLYGEDGAEVSHSSLTERMMSFDGTFVKMLTIGGVATPPHLRRLGCVRISFNEFLRQGRQRGIAFALLHPFAFAYYNKFGFERVSDTIICDFPIAALDFLPRYSNLVPFADSRLGDLLEAYNAFALKRNLSCFRYTKEHFLRKPKWEIYMDYGESGKPEGYVIVECEYHYDGINRNVSDNLHVWELVSANQASLQRLLGFLRMYEGQMETVRFHDIGMAPEIDLTMRKYMQMQYDVHPDIQARILDIDAAFHAMTWPEKPGQFSMRVDDTLPDVKGTFQLEYGQGVCTCQRLADDAPVDFEVSEQALVRLMMGSDAYDAETVTYLPGVTLNGNADDVLRAFPKRRIGAYEHF